MGGVIHNAKRYTDHLCHALPGPHLAAEAVGLGATMQQIGQTRQLVRRQSTGCTGRWAIAEGLRAVLSSPFQPLADGGSADPQRLGDLMLRPAFLQELPGLHAPRFFPVVRDGVQTSQNST